MRKQFTAETPSSPRTIFFAFLCELCVFAVALGFGSKEKIKVFSVSSASRR
jgi:hypothetical protein